MRRLLGRVIPQREQLRGSGTSTGCHIKTYRWCRLVHWPFGSAWSNPNEFGLLTGRESNHLDSRHKYITPELNMPRPITWCSCLQMLQPLKIETFKHPGSSGNPSAPPWMWGTEVILCSCSCLIPFQCVHRRSTNKHQEHTNSTRVSPRRFLWVPVSPSKMFADVHPGLHSFPPPGLTTLLELLGIPPVETQRKFSWLTEDLSGALQCKTCF